jgi:hypothetical protein
MSLVHYVKVETVGWVKVETVGWVKVETVGWADRDYPGWIEVHLREADGTTQGRTTFHVPEAALTTSR